MVSASIITISMISPRSSFPGWKGGVSISMMEPSRMAPPSEEAWGSLMHLESASWHAVLAIVACVTVLLEDEKAYIFKRSVGNALIQTNEELPQDQRNYWRMAICGIMSNLATSPAIKNECCMRWKWSDE
mmetsp:Transcript_7377/g.16726  ORF Transcript_7377/g.16726 Transcript_7377/m.16726 type:complete len:130 (+) Transcript_7377:2212-2601(+)